MSGGHYTINIYECVSASDIDELRRIQSDLKSIDDTDIVINEIDLITQNLISAQIKYASICDIIHSLDYYHCGDYGLNQVIEAVAKFKKVNEPTKRN
ncbi:MAG TPA: hypothetical protein PLX69_21520 [Leptospiraceae bacterium]|nr:hypothetical protein [Leptospiraceae bacterium]